MDLFSSSQVILCVLDGYSLYTLLDRTLKGRRSVVDSVKFLDMFSFIVQCDVTAWSELPCSLYLNRHVTVSCLWHILLVYFLSRGNVSLEWYTR
jgi:hypothetical protein